MAAQIATVDRTDTLAVLRAARAWLSDPKHWTQHAYWRGQNGHPVWQIRAVTRTCAVGALGLVTGDDAKEGPEQARLALWRAIGGSISNYNDRGKPREAYTRVLAAYDNAIATLEAEARR